ncbi:hypothetical protein [Kitasatospora sp. NPDC001095]
MPTAETPLRDEFAAAVERVADRTLAVLQDGGGTAALADPDSLVPRPLPAAVRVPGADLFAPQLLTGAEPDGTAAALLSEARFLPPWYIPGLPGAGAVRADGADLLRYLRAHLDGGPATGPDGGLVRGPGPGPATGPDGGPATDPDGGLRTALRDVQRLRLRLPHSTDRIGLVWMHRRSGDRDLSFHSGGTRGFTAFVGFSQDGQAAVAAVANTAPALDGRFVQAGYEVLRAASRPEGAGTGPLPGGDGSAREGTLPPGRGRFPVQTATALARSAAMFTARPARTVPIA